MNITWLTGLHIPSWLIADPVLWLSTASYVLILAFAARFFLWRQLGNNVSQQHVYFGAIVLLLLMWGFKAGVTPGLGFHHLGATLFLLMFGWARALIGLTVVLVASYLISTPDWQSFGINGVISVVLPVFTSYAVLRASWKWLPDNFFIYVFVCAFFNAAIAVAVSRTAATMVLYLAGTYPLDVLIEESLSYLPLFMFPEAFITGLLITVFVVYLPHWVETFDDDRYLKGK